MAADGTPTWFSFSSNKVWTRGLDSFSTIPTMAEINASSGINQIIAFLNRKQSQVNGATAISYLPNSNVTLSASFCTSIATAIDALQASIGNTTSTGTLAANRPMSAAFWTACQANLALGYAVGKAAGWVHTESQNPFGTHLSDPINTSETLPMPANIGLVGSGPYSRTRYGASFLMPTISGTGANIEGTYTALWGGQSGGTDTSLYASTSDDHAYTPTEPNWWKNRNNFCSSLNIRFPPSGPDEFHTWTIPNSALSGRFGSYLSLILGATSELTNVNASPDQFGTGNLGFTSVQLFF